MTTTRTASGVTRPLSAGAGRAGLAALFGARTVSVVGAAMTYVAVPWFVLEITGSVARTGAVVAVYGVGTAVAGFLAGPLVDRFGLKRSSVAANLVGSAAMVAIVLMHTAGELSMAALLVLVVVAAAADAPAGVALSGLVPRLARAAGTPLERANSAVRAVSGAGRLVGPALGGVMAVLVGAHHVLLLDAAAGVVAALLVGLFVPSLPAEVPGSDGRRAGYLAELREGVRAIRRIPLAVNLAVIGATHSMLDGGLVGIVLVLIAYQWWGDPAVFGVMVTAFGAGALAGTALYGAIGHRLPRRPIFVGGALVVGLPLVPLAYASSPAVAVAALAAIGLTAGPVGPLTTSALQQAVPQRLYGRVMGTVRVLAVSASPLGIAAVAAATEVFELRSIILGMAGIYLLVGLSCWQAPAFRDLDRVRQKLESQP